LVVEAILTLMKTAKGRRHNSALNVELDRYLVFRAGMNTCFCGPVYVKAKVYCGKKEFQLEGSLQAIGLLVVTTQVVNAKSFLVPQRALAWETTSLLESPTKSKFKRHFRLFCHCGSSECPELD